MLGLARPTGAATNRVVALGVTLVVILGIIVNQLNLSDDPYRCKAALHDGSWLDPPDDEGNRDPFAHWQPRGCMMHQYKPQEIADCVEGRPIYFFGDSTTRQVFYAMARLLDRDLADETRAKSYKHGIHDMEFAGVRLRQVWIPLMEEGDSRLDVQDTLELYRDERLNSVAVEDQKSPAIVFMGVGIWYAARMEEGVSLDEFTKVFNNVSDTVHQQDLAVFGTRPMDPTDGIGNELFLAPPVPPFYDSMPEDRRTGIASVPGEMEAIDDFLLSQEEETKINMLWSYPALQREQVHAMVDLKNGFHVIDPVAEAKANILLNLRCNAKLDAKDGFPYDRTCCTDYGQRSFVQLVLVGGGLLYVVAAFILELTALLFKQAPRWTAFNLDAGMFVTALLACYWADRTQSFAKGHKEFVPMEFQLLSVLAVFAGAFAMTKSRPPPAKPGAPEAPTTLEDTKPLSRDQTDEWKGWMQAVILIYHWTGASRILDIYVFVRLLVAAYLFQTGYGHATYFVLKKDFSFKRVAAVILRLNLLSCALPYVMNTTYIFYYFAPLVSFWFFVIYATFAVGQKYNDNIYALLTKIFISILIFPGLMLWTPITEWIFVGLRFLFRIDWDLHEWEFRLGLDGLIVYIGMLMGIASVKTKIYNRILTETYGLAGIAGLASIPLYLWVASTNAEAKSDYTKYHPYVSFLPILGFIALRNINRQARTWYSWTFAWLGRCSLETFTLQFHIFLAADTKGVLLLDIFEGDGSLLGDRWRALVVIVPLFLWISWRVADATGALVKILTSNVDDPARAEELDLEGKADVQPLIGNSSWLSPITRHIPSGSSWARNLKLRMVALLVLLWVLNLVY